MTPPTKHPWPLYAAAVFGVLLFCGTLVNATWNGLVDYRTRDGLEFSHAMYTGNYGYTLMAHRCFSAVYNKCFEDLPGEPRDNDNECVPPISNRCRCDHVAAAFCYTTFPVVCGTPDRTGKLNFDACDRVFPHGFKHFKELLIGR